MAMKLETRVFELSNGKYANLTELARAMGMSLSEVYRVKQGQRHIHEKFIIGAIKAFPGYKFDDLFYVVPEEGSERVRQIVKEKPKPQKPDLQSKVMLTTRDVAQLLGVHPNTVRRWARKGILKAYRISSRGDTRFWREDVDSFLKEGEMG